MIEQNQTSHHQLNRYPAAVSGFTLIELMISLVLGLLISAAVMQVYLINTRTITVQQSASEVQDSTIFAMCHFPQTLSKFHITCHNRYYRQGDIK